MADDVEDMREAVMKGGGRLRLARLAKRGSVGFIRRGYGSQRRGSVTAPVMALGKHIRDVNRGGSNMVSVGALTAQDPHTDYRYLLCKRLLVL